MRLVRILSVVVVVAAITACAGDALGPPDDAPDVQGIVIDYAPDYRLLVAASVASDIYPDTFFVNPGSGTKVLVVTFTLPNLSERDAIDPDLVRVGIFVVGNSE